MLTRFVLKAGFRFSAEVECYHDWSVRNGSRDYLGSYLRDLGWRLKLATHFHVPLKLTMFCALLSRRFVHSWLDF
jgi:hypothetical protein